jgi:predicted heme/steroid binding protein
MQEYTEAELALRNGQDRPEIWTCFEGIIYDVSQSKLWMNGKHYQHWAGCDLTEHMAKAPHTERVFDGLPVVGKLKR